MKKFLAILSIVLVVILSTGCTRVKGYKYNVTTGDTIQITIETNGGYNISSDVPFKITKDNDTLTQGAFITTENYEQYLTAINSDSRSNIIEQKTKGNIEYTFYSYNNTEYNYVIKIKNSNTGILLGNNTSKESAEECFNRLRIRKDK